ncbi:General transcription factor II-I repeat domain-containing protein 2-like [Oopsacas minuta]|uniref:General transcription factor II-I repeat domain-containing protein 2-like n=1 Tax=Oopsacas minuta TaxID=111878 RepID=A0AAV7KDH0_9METZ|nr:General transcription factor II-I repeat domain-containing protein 2-like [Oopsacas minuta]
MGALLMKCSENISIYSICLHESTDVGDTAQLSIFVRSLDSDFNITEDLLEVCSMRSTTTGEQLFAELKNSLLKYDLTFFKIIGLTTDGAPCMLGKGKGVVALALRELSILGLESDLIISHCIIHQGNLCAKRLRMNNVMSVVVNTVNFMRSKALDHRQFKEFLIEINAEYGDVTYYSEVRWLSRGNCLIRFDSLYMKSNFSSK